MNICYQRSLNHNYMIIQDCEEYQMDYQLKMLIENKIAGLLDCMIHRVNNELWLYYEISSRHCLRQLFERRKMNASDIKQLIKGFLPLIKAGEDYLLDMDHVILDLEYIFLNPQTYAPEFCFYPGYNKDITKGVHDLAENILNFVDYEDKKAVELAYEFHAKTAEDNYSMQNLLSLLSDKPEELPAKEITGDKMLLSKEAVEGKTEEANFMRDDCFEEKPRHAGLLFFRSIIEKIRSYFSREQENDYYIESGSYIRDESSYQVQQEKKVCVEEDGFSGTNQETLTINIGNGCRQEPPNYGNTVLMSADSKGVILSPEPGNTQQTMEISVFPFLIGKLADAVDAVVPEESISRIHAKIFKEGEQFFVMDLNSTNGTFVNDRELAANETCEITGGNILRLGRIKYRFDIQ